jgi:hypothetical protein
MDRRVKRRFFPWTGTAGLAALLVFGFWADQMDGGAKEFPIPTTVTDLASQPKQYDGSRVFVSGTVREANLEKGRRGSEFLSIVLEETEPKGADRASVQVFSLTLLSVDSGSRVSVQGTYHHDSYYGGWRYDNFIAAETIIQDQFDDGPLNKGSGL